MHVPSHPLRHHVFCLIPCSEILPGKGKPVSFSDVKAVADSHDLPTEEKVKQLQAMLQQQVRLLWSTV